MKKTILLACMIAFSANAQKVRIGVQGGISIANPSISGSSNLSSIEKTFAPYGGLVLDVDLGLLKFRPSINYLQTDVKTLSSQSIPALLPGGLPTTTEISNLRKTQNLEIPLDLVYPIKTKAGSILLFAAPTITVGLKAQVTLSSTSTTGTSTSTSLSTTTDLNYGTNNLEIKKYDLGTKIGVGFEFNENIQLNFGYKLGFTDVNNAAQSLKNNTFSLTGSYFF